MQKFSVTSEVASHVEGRFIPVLRSIAALHLLHSNCGKTLLQRRNKVKFILTRKAMSCSGKAIHILAPQYNDLYEQTFKLYNSTPKA